MHDFTAPISRRLAAALHRLWKEPTDAKCLRVSRDAEVHAQPTQLDDWEDEGGAMPPTVTPADGTNAPGCVPAKNTPERKRSGV